MKKVEDAEIVASYCLFEMPSKPEHENKDLMDRPLISLVCLGEDE